MLEKWAKDSGTGQTIPVMPIWFKDDPLFLVGSPEFGGAICTKEQFENCQPSIATLDGSTGQVYRYGKLIGTKEDIRHR